jgi:hypothetical protein
MNLHISKKVLIGLFLLINVKKINSQSCWTMGPMLHVNFGGEKIRASWALEFAYWNFNSFPYSFDFAAEFERKKIRLYSEVQTGFLVAGISGGPVIEFQTAEKKVKLGLQTSVWANYYWGFDFRMRFIDNKSLICPGTYFKIPISGRDENGEKITGSSNNSSNDWDFD